jgi:patatin-like phospholipase/acyl hydrolase
MLVRLRNLTGRRISDMFDLVVGVSAGGLVALSLLADKTLEEMAEVYLTRGYMCFSPEDEVNKPPPSDASVESKRKKKKRTRFSNVEPPATVVLEQNHSSVDQSRDQRFNVSCKNI